LIGVQDDGKILGLKSDYTSLSQKTRRGGRDAFERQLRQVVSSHLGKLFNQHVDIHFVEVQGKDVCLVDISHAYKAAWIKEKGHVIFYVRSGNQTVPLDPQEAVEYISHTWRSP
jgi:predicted HTH transcriptional regulator